MIVKTTHGTTLLGAVLALAGCDPQIPSGPEPDDPGIVIPGRGTQDDQEEEWKDDPLPSDHAPSCGEETLSFEFATPEVMLVLDKSGSMAGNTWDHDRDAGTPEITRWASLHQVVQNVTDDFDAQMHLGAVLFPAIDAPNQSSAAACMLADAPSAPVSPLGGQAVLDSLPAADATNIYGGTPATAGVRMAMDHLLGVADENPQAIVLVTDGAANCAHSAMGSGLFLQYDEALPIAAAQAFAAGIPVYVVGIDIEDEVLDLPVANPWERLSEVADYGGAPRSGGVPFYDVFDELELDAALSSIAQEVSCSVPVPEDFEASRLSVSIDGELVPAATTCDSGDGWIADEARSVRLCPNSCLLAQESTAVEATLSCIPEG